MTYQAPPTFTAVGVNNLTTVKTSDYTVTSTDNGKVIPANTTSGSFTITLPAASAGFSIGVVDYAGTFNLNSIRIIAPGSVKINNITPGQWCIGEINGAVTLISDGVDWFSLATFRQGGAFGTRANFRGGSTSASNALYSSYVRIETAGNLTRGCDLVTYALSMPSSHANRTRGYIAGGNRGGAADSNIIEYFAIAADWSGTDFGDLSSGRMYMKGGGNDTYGIVPGGYTGSAAVNIIDRVNMASGGGTDIGDLTTARRYAACANSTTRIVMMGGATVSNVIDRLEIATGTNATDVGDLQNKTYGAAGSSSSTRGIVAGGFTTAAVNIIDYITIATDSQGSSTFGELTAVRYYCGCATNSIKMLITAGADGAAALTNIVDYVTIATTGNATDFGDTVEATQNMAGFSNGHGGLA